MFNVFTSFTAVMAVHRKDSSTIPFPCSFSSMHVHVWVLIHGVQGSCTCLITLSSYSLQKKNKSHIYKHVG